MVDRKRLLPILIAIVQFLLISIKRGSANDPPRFLMSSSEILLQLREGLETPAGSRILTVTGADPDEGDSLEFGVRGQVGNDLLTIETINKTAANIYLKRELDRETQDSYQLILTLTDGHLANTIEQSLYILVEDINDNQPVFKPYNTTVHIKENSPPGIIGINLEATDLDEGIFGQVIYTLQENSGNFKIETINGVGVLSLVNSLDYEENQLYQLQVLATDMSNVPNRRHTGTAAIVIMVDDVEDQPPEFIRVPSVTKIPEDLPPLSKIFQVWAVDGDRGINNQIHYSIIEGGNDLFGIERETGWAFVKNRTLDREALNGDNHSNPSPNPNVNSNGAYILRIRAKEVDSHVTPTPIVDTELTIILIDVNDEIPRFRSDIYIGEISENTQLNVPVTFLGNSRPEVYDYDQGKNGTFSLSLIGDGDDDAVHAFEITPSEGINEATFLIRVKNHTLLDYERRKSMQFQIIAHEVIGVGVGLRKMSSNRLSRANVTIYIRDANDNVPEFDADDYEAHVREDAGPGTFVIKVRAHDPDSGHFGQLGLRYTEIRGQIGHKLSLNSVTGEISVKSGGEEFDREQFSTYFLTIEVRDDLGRGNRNTVQLRLIIDDVNDNAPQFLQNQYEIRIDENVDRFFHPFYVEAFERDLEETSNGIIRFDIVDGDKFGNFSIDTNTGEIQPTRPLDFEAIDEITIVDGHRHFNLTVRASDLGKPSMSTNVSVIVYVKDKNDHQPEFLESSYNATMRENAKYGDKVLQVNAKDGDGSLQNSRIVYRIISVVQDKFMINAETGLITVTQSANLDPDLTNPKTTVHVLQVAAVDGGIGTEQKEAIVFVNINVLDVNNKPPGFKEMNTVTITENSKIGTVITRLEAVDLDDNPDLHFALADSGHCDARNEDGGRVSKLTMTSGCGGMFEVTWNGVVKVKGSLDREFVEMVILRVTVEDRNAYGTKQEATGLLTIRILDVNDNDPVFEKDLYRRALTENSKPGTSIVTVIADDLDINRSVTYKLDGANHLIGLLLLLDPQTGEIVVSAKVDREMYSWLNFSVEATDNGIPSRFTRTNVSIQILDENDNNPVFSLDDYSLNIFENISIGTVIGEIEATDADIGEYGRITYILDKKSADGKFIINPETGMLLVSGRLDRETKDKYSLIVEAWDNYNQGFATSESRKAFKQISVTILDSNDEPPLLLLNLLDGCVSISEYHGVGEVITLIKANDKDDENTLNGQVDLSIVDGNQKQLFALDQVDTRSSRLIVSAPLKQQVGNYSLSIGLTDRGSPKLTSTGHLTICVNDFNDHAPRFIEPLNNHTIRIPENASVGSQLIKVEAVDDDMGLNGQIRYRIVNDKLQNDWKTFQIDAITGIVILQLSLDREKQKKYEIRVEARDLGDPTPLASDIDLHFYVKNVVDVQPKFKIPRVEILFTENAKPKSEIQVLPETVDTEEYESDSERATICYFVVQGDEENTFDVDPMSHNVTVRRPLDREVRQRHEFIIKATKDCRTLTTQQSRMKAYDPKNRQFLKVIVNVLDINDNGPRFVDHVFTGGMSSELATYGTVVLKIQAIDADAGANARLSYYLDGVIKSSLSNPAGHSNIDSFRSQPPPFIVNRTSGEILLNFYPQKKVKGYFHFNVMVNDSGGHNDSARVMIYLVREDQKVTFTLRLAPDELRPRISHFQRMLSNLTDMIVNVDVSKYHENKDGSVDRTKTDILTHFVQKADNSIANVKTVVDLIDDKIEALNSLFREYNVLECKPTISNDDENTDASEILLAGLVGITICLIILLLLTISICFYQRNRYQMQLKAATAVAFGSQSSGLNRTNVPNTNQHSIEGSNPIWMHSYENDWYKENDVMSLGSRSNNSLDENDVLDVCQLTSSTDEANSSLYSGSRSTSGIDYVDVTVTNRGIVAVDRPPCPPARIGVSHDGSISDDCNDLNKLQLNRRYSDDQTINSSSSTTTSGRPNNVIIDGSSSILISSSHHMKHNNHHLETTEL